MVLVVTKNQAWITKSKCFYHICDCCYISNYLSEILLKGYLHYKTFPCNKVALDL